MAALINQIGLVGIYLLAAALFYRIYSWNYVITPGKASRRYSAFVVVLTLVIIGVTFLVNESAGEPIAESGLIPWFFVLFLHAWSYKVQSPVSVLVSISYVVAGLTLGLLFFLVGWAAPATGSWGPSPAELLLGLSVTVAVGLIGILIVLYVLRESSIKKKRVAVAEEEGPVINEQ